MAARFLSSTHKKTHRNAPKIFKKNAPFCTDARNTPFTIPPVERLFTTLQPMFCRKRTVTEEETLSFFSLLFLYLPRKTCEFTKDFLSLPPNPLKPGKSLRKHPFKQENSLLKIYQGNLNLRFRGPGRRSLGARSQKVSKKVSKKSPRAGSQKSEKSLENGPKSPKKSENGFLETFRTFFETFFGLSGPWARETFSRLFGFGPRDSPSPRSTEPQI